MKHSKTLRLTRCGLFTALVTVGAFIQIPVPYMDYFTLQFLFVLLAGLVLGAKDGMYAVGAYVLIGLAGVPVFAAGGGLQYLLRPSFGYLIGFVVAAFCTGAVSKKLPKSFGGYLAACICGFIVTYGIGLAYKYMILNVYMGEVTPFYVVLASCFPLDIPGDLVLCALSAFLAGQLNPVLRRMDHGYC